MFYAQRTTKIPKNSLKQVYKAYSVLEDGVGYFECASCQKRSPRNAVKKIENTATCTQLTEFSPGISD